MRRPARSSSGWASRESRFKQAKQAVKLEEPLLAANASPATAYLLEDQLKTLWLVDDKASTQCASQEWHDMGSGIAALECVARRLRGTEYLFLRICAALPGNVG